MKAIKIILVILIVLIIVITGIYAYYGGFSSVYIVESKQGGEIIVYENVTGDYSQAAEVSNKVYYTLLDNYKIETTKGFGIYYDNPQEVEKSKLRSEVGCILNALPDSVTMTNIVQKFNTRILPEGDYITAEFPMKGGLSIMIGIFKVYPVINKYLEEKGIDNNSPVMEIYDVPNSKIIYRKQIIQ